MRCRYIYIYVCVCVSVYGRGFGTGYVRNVEAYVGNEFHEL